MEFCIRYIANNGFCWFKSGMLLTNQPSVKESFSELKEHVSWTPINELSRLTVVVLVFSIIFALLIWIADTILSRVVKIYFEFIN